MIKEGWERAEEPVSLNQKQINEIVQSVFPEKRVLTAERLGGGLSNSSYKIVLEQSSVPYVLRLFRDNGAIAQKEQEIARLVHATVPVANYIHVDTSCGIYGKPWALVEWKEGVLLRDIMKRGAKEDIASAAYSVGSTLAHIHRYTFLEAGFFGKALTIPQPMPMSAESFLTIMESILFHGSCAHWLGEELTQRLWLLCQTKASVLSQVHEKPVLVHSDFNGLNILMHPKQDGCTVSAVLDWEFAFSWRRHVDIANLLRYEEDNSVFEQHFIRAYQEHGGVLQENWKLISKLEDLLALCDMLSHSTETMPNRIRDLKSLITNTVHRFG